MSTIGNAGINNHRIFFLNRHTAKTRTWFQIKSEIWGKVWFHYIFSYKGKHLPMYHNNHGNHQKQQRRCQDLLPGVPCIPSMLLGRHNSGGSVWSGPVLDARVPSLQNDNPTTGKPHNHDPSETNVTYSFLYTKARLAMKEQATNTRDKPSQIFAQVVANCNDYVQAMMPREENCKRTMRYQRPTPPVPQSLAEVTITEEFTETSHHQPFLLYDHGQDAVNRMLVFCTDYSL